jgi:hypothetical protein
LCSISSGWDMRNLPLVVPDKRALIQDP